MDRRPKLLSVLLAGLVLASGATLGGAALGQQSTATANAGGEWSTDRADAGRTGSTDGSGPRGPYATTAWNETDEKRVGAEPSGATVSNGTVYVASRNVGDLHLYSSEGEVAAFDAETGDAKWKRTDIGATVGSPTVVGDTVYVAVNGVDDYLSTEDQHIEGVYALDADTGETKWEYHDMSQPTGSPVVVDGTVFVAERMQGQRNVTALDADTGERRWKRSLSGEKYHDAKVAVAGDTLYALAENLTALDPSDGSTKWSSDLPPNAEVKGWAVTESAVYLTAPPNEVYKLSTDGGNVEWQARLQTSREKRPDNVTAPAVANGTVYVATDGGPDVMTGDDGTHVGAVHALDADTGKAAWTFETAAKLTAAPAVANETVYVGGEYPSVDDAENEREAANETGSDYVFDHPSQLIDTSMSNSVAYAIDRENGTERWSYAADVTAGRGADTNSVVPAGGHLYVWTSSSDVPVTTGLGGDMYALESNETPPSKENRVANDASERLGDETDDGNETGDGNDSPEETPDPC